VGVRWGSEFQDFLITEGAQHPVISFFRHVVDLGSVGNGQDRIARANTTHRGEPRNIREERRLALRRLADLEALAWWGRLADQKPGDHK
jgi:hypothetical protein